MSDTTPVQRATAAVARAHLIGDSEKIAAARRDLTAAKLESAIRAAVAAAPALSEAQKRRLAALLVPAGGDKR